MTLNMNTHTQDSSFVSVFCSENKPPRLPSSSHNTKLNHRNDISNDNTNILRELGRVSSAYRKQRPKKNSSMLQRLNGMKKGSLPRTSWRALTRDKLSKIKTKLRAIANAPSKRQLLRRSSSIQTHQKIEKRQQTPKPRAIVCGGGPAGATAAMFLARNGYQVDVFESKGEPQSTNINSHRAYMIALTDRGLAALEDLGIDISQRSQCDQGKIAVHCRLGTWSSSCEERSVCFTRAALAQMLIDQAREKYPDSIRFHFNHDCKGVDVANKVVKFEQRHTNAMANECQSLVEIPYDLLIGADGVNSMVRASLQKALPDFCVDIVDSGREYKSFHSLPAAGLQGAQGVECSTLHLWPGNNPASMISAHTAGDGTFSGTLSLRAGEFAGLYTPSDVASLLRDQFPKLPTEWIEPMARQLDAATSGQASTVGHRVTCSQIHGPGIVLLGDAAHAVSPVFGQGANSALESCLVLGRALERAQGDVESLPETFNKLRSPDTHALSELDAKAHSLFWRGSHFDAVFMQVAVHLMFGGLLTMLSGGKKPNLLQIGRSVSYKRLHRELIKDSQWTAVLSGTVMLTTIVIALSHATLLPGAIS